MPKPSPAIKEDELASLIFPLLCFFHRHPRLERRQFKIGGLSRAICGNEGRLFSAHCRTPFETQKHWAAEERRLEGPSFPPVPPFLHVSKVFLSPMFT
jgi:hypothetical protein